MKKLLSLFAVLSLGVAFLASPAVAKSKLRTVSPSWGTWTPQGFVAVADTTFLNGATQAVDTTGPISTADWDWAPFANSADPNAAFLSVFKVFTSGSLVSTDTMRVLIEGSVNGQYWSAFSAGTSGGGGTLTQIGAGGGTQQAFASPVNLAAPTRGASSMASATLTLGMPAPVPFIRLIVSGDGNTAARAAALKAHISYWHTDGGPGKASPVEWKRLRFATYGPNGLVSTSFKDTSSVRFSAPDTTEWFDVSQAKVGMADIASAADTTALGAYLYVEASSDPSGNDSIYVCVDGSPDAYRWNLTPLTGTAGGFLAAVSAGSGPAAVNALFGLPAHVVTALSAGPGAMSGTPFLRFRIFAGNGGEVLGGAKVWIGYRKNTYQD